MSTKLLFLTVPLAICLGCGDSKSDLEKCVDEHKAEKLTETDAIGECLVDELMQSFATQADCEAYVAAHGGFADSKVEGCKRYFEEKTETHHDAGTTD